MDNTLELLALTVNGEPMQVPPGTTLAGLIARLELDTRKVAVERNLEIVPRSTYVALSAGDALEIVHFIGGG
jgi:thiamine biosynthesis protein ThiS